MLCRWRHSRGLWIGELRPQIREIPTINFDQGLSNWRVQLGLMGVARLGCRRRWCGVWWWCGGHRRGLRRCWWTGRWRRVGCLSERRRWLVEVASARNYRKGWSPVIEIQERFIDVKTFCTAHGTDKYISYSVCLSKMQQEYNRQQLKKYCIGYYNCFTDTSGIVIMKHDFEIWTFIYKVKSL